MPDNIKISKMPPCNAEEALERIFLALADKIDAQEAELSRLREQNAALTQRVERHSPCGRGPTISNKALQAACDTYANCNICEADPMRAALSAALPLLLEEKREEIAREARQAFCSPHSGSYAIADRIIAMLGGGE